MLALFEPKPSILDHGEGDAAGRHGAVRRAYAAWLAISGPSPSAACSSVRHPDVSREIPNRLRIHNRWGEVL